MRILHLSDLHLPVPWRVLPIRCFMHPKRIIGGLNLRLRRHRVFRDGLQRLDQWQAFARQSAADVILFTGDVCTLGTDAELAWCRRALQPLIDAAPRFVCLPGNHDVYVGRAPWRRHFGDLCPGTGDAEGWPRKVSLTDDFSLFLIDSAQPRHSPMSRGSLPLTVTSRLAQQLQDEPGMRMVAMHHSPWRANGRPDSAFHGLQHRRALLAGLQNQPRCVLVYGHLHQGFSLHPKAMPPVFCAGSATHQHTAGGWWFEWENGQFSARRLTCDAQGVHERPGAGNLMGENL